MVALSADTSPCNVASIFSCCVSFCMSAPLGDGCVRTPSYVRERAGTHPHHGSPRRQRGMRFESPLSISLVCVACPRSSSEPLCQAISTVDVLKTRVRKPVVGSMFVDSAVRVEWWKGVVVAFISVVLLRCDSAIDRSSFFCAKKSLRTLPKNSQRLERSGHGNVQ